MLKIFSAIAVVGLLIGLAATPVFAESPESQAGQKIAADRPVSEAAALGGELGGRRFASDQESTSTRDATPGVHPIADSPRGCLTEGGCVADPESARRVLGAILASMGAREAPPAKMVDLLTPAP
jgi:hypothetical protein